MYTLDCTYYRKEFETLEELLKDIVNSGMDPNYEIMHNGKLTGDKAIDLLEI